MPRLVTVFVDEARSLPLLRALAATRAIAATFGRGTDHKCIQLKGADAAIGPPGRGDAKIMAAYRERLAAHFERLGMPRSRTRVYLGDTEAPAVAEAVEAVERAGTVARCTRPEATVIQTFQAITSMPARYSRPPVRRTT